MNKQPKKITAIVGSYRKGGIIEQAVDEILGAAHAEGAETVKVFLLDRHIEFCTNCRICAGQPGLKRGICPLQDDLTEILDTIEGSDALVLASPMNFWTVTAVMKRFMERLICYSYWPWSGMAPKVRSRKIDKRAVLVISSAAPSLLARISTRMAGLMKGVALLLGAKTAGTLWIGLAARKQEQDIGWLARKRAARMGRMLAL